MASKRSPNGGVTVRMFDPGTGWTLDEARSLVRQGYSLAHVEGRTGWPRAMLLAGQKRAAVSYRNSSSTRSSTGT